MGKPEEQADHQVKSIFNQPEKFERYHVFSSAYQVYLTSSLLIRPVFKKPCQGLKKLDRFAVIS